MTVTKPMTIEEMNDVLFLLAEVDRLRQELQAAQAREAKAIGCIEDALEIAARWGLDLNMEPWAAISEARQALTTGEGGAGDV